MRDADKKNIIKKILAIFFFQSTDTRMKIVFSLCNLIRKISPKTKQYKCKYKILIITRKKKKTIKGKTTTISTFFSLSFCVFAKNSKSRFAAPGSLFLRTVLEFYTAWPSSELIRFVRIELRKGVPGSNEPFWNLYTRLLARTPFWTPKLAFSPLVSFKLLSQWNSRTFSIHSTFEIIRYLFILPSTPSQFSLWLPAVFCSIDSNWNPLLLLLFLFFFLCPIVRSFGSGTRITTLLSTSLIIFCRLSLDLNSSYATCRHGTRRIGLLKAVDLILFELVFEMIFRICSNLFWWELEALIVKETSTNSDRRFQLTPTHHPKTN